MWLIKRDSGCIFQKRDLKKTQIYPESFRRLLEVPIAPNVFDNITFYDGGLLEEFEFPEGQDVCPSLIDIVEFFNRFYIPVIICVGLLGNILSGIVFMTSHLKLRSSSYYLAALATVDFVFLFDLLIVYISNETSFDIFNRNGWCQWIVYISSVCSILSVWLIVAFTTERFIAVQYPLQRPHICTVSRAKVIISTLGLIAVLSQTYSFVTAGIISPEQLLPFVYNSSIHHTNTSEIPSTLPIKLVCGLRPGYQRVMNIINIIDTLTTLICPVIVIVVMNTMIARNLLLFRQSFLQQGNFDDRPRDYSGTESYTLQLISAEKVLNSLNGPPQSGSSNKPHNHSHRHIHSTSTRQGRNRTYQRADQLPRCIQINSSRRSQQNITKMLLLISTVFIILNLPSYVIRLYAFFFFSLWHLNPPAMLWCVQQMFMLLYYTHFSVNFLLYAVCGATFRRCLAKVFSNFFTYFSNYRHVCCRVHHRRNNRHQQSSNGMPLPQLR